MNNINKNLVKQNILTKQKRNFINLPNAPKTSKLRIMQYNILAPSNIEPHLFPSHKKQHLDKEKRYLLIIEEILVIKPDILCIQELDKKDIIYFEKMSKNLKMKYIYKQKKHDEKIDGNAIFYKENKFCLEKNFFIDCNFKKDKNYNKNDILEKELYYPTVVLFAIFSYKENPKEKFIVTTTHLPFNKNKGHVKLGILVLILKCLLVIKKNFEIKNGFFIGDFNCLPNSMLYDYLIDYKVNLNSHICEYSNQKLAINMRKKCLNTLKYITHSKFRPFHNFYEMKYIDENFLSQLCSVLPIFNENDDKEIFFENFENGKKGEFFCYENCVEYLNCLAKENGLISSYSEFYQNFNSNFKKNMRLEANLTHFARDIKTTVDYIFQFGDGFRVFQILKCPKIEYFQNLKRTLPIDFFGSDHISLVSDYE